MLAPFLSNLIANHNPLYGRVGKEASARCISNRGTRNATYNLSILPSGGIYRCVTARKSPPALPNHLLFHFLYQLIVSLIGRRRAGVSACRRVAVPAIDRVGFSSQMR